MKFIYSTTKFMEIELLISILCVYIMILEIRLWVVWNTSILSFYLALSPELDRLLFILVCLPIYCTQPISCLKTIFIAHIYTLNNCWIRCPNLLDAGLSCSSSWFDFVVFLTKTSSISASFICSFISLEAKYFHLFQSRLRDVSLPHHIRKIVEESSESVPFCIDAAQTGTVARFINHSCHPNLFVQCVLSDHHDIRLARVMLIAADNIPALKVCFLNLMPFVL